MTYIGVHEKDKTYSKAIKNIEDVLFNEINVEKIDEERSNRSKSSYVWFDDKSNRVKVEIGSSVRPDPYSKKKLKSYIQEYLEAHNEFYDVVKYELGEIELNVLSIERTFIDKVMSVKRHAVCGSIDRKVRHIYDVTRLFYMPEIQAFLNDKDKLKHLISITKKTDEYYINKRRHDEVYDATGPYDFSSWKNSLNKQIRSIYENLHKELLYTDEPQNFHKALQVFSEINDIFIDIGE